jgi:hypothetical protein
MPLTQEQFESLPEFVKSDYTQHEGAYVPVAELKVGKLKDSLNGLDSKLREFEKNEQAKLEAARAEALEKLKKEGKVDEILADAERRIGETKAQYEERLQRMTTAIKTEKRSALVADLASELATDSGSKAFKRLVADRIDVDPETGKVTFLNDDGSASSLDFAGFKAELLKDDSFAPLLKAGVVTKGGGNAQGSTGAGGASSVGNLGGSRAEREAALARKFKLPIN